VLALWPKDMLMNIVTLKQDRAAVIAQMRALHDRAEAAHRDLTAEEAEQFDRLDAEQERRAREIDALENRSHPTTRRAGTRDGLAALDRELSRSPGPSVPPGGDAWTPRHRAGEVRLLTPAESVRSCLTTTPPDGIRAEDLSLGRLVVAAALGDARRAEAEIRTMGGATFGAGGALVAPETLSSDVVDLARARAVIFRAGALTLAMPSAEFSFAREAGDPTAVWKGENLAADESDVTLQRVTLRSRTLMALTRCSMELLQDAPNAPAVIERSLAQALALELDRACLRGGETAGSVSPTGVRFYTGVNVVPTVGAILLDDFADAAGTVAAANGPAADGLTAILAPRDWTRIDKLKDGEGLPLRGPASWEAMQKLVTNQLPATLGVGGNESEAIVGPFSQMVVGMRMELSIEVSRTASDAFGKYQALVRAVLRGDMVLEHENHFVALTGILPS
jgi:HK97 family phage major capsid protein